MGLKILVSNGNIVSATSKLTEWLFIREAQSGQNKTITYIPCIFISSPNAWNNLNVQITRKIIVTLLHQANYTNFLYNNIVVKTSYSNV